MKLIDRGAVIRLMILFVLLTLATAAAWFTMIRMPGRSYRGPLPPLTQLRHDGMADDAAHRLPSGEALVRALRRDVTMLAGEIGPRNAIEEQGLRRAESFITQELTRAGYSLRRDTFVVDHVTCANLKAEVRGVTKPEKIVVVGAHYDSVAVDNCPAANDNGSGVAALLALARAFHGCRIWRMLRFVAFANEEPPYFQTDRMGSLIYAKRCRQRGDRIVGMLSLETIGYYTDAPHSQEYPGRWHFCTLPPATSSPLSATCRHAGWFARWSVHSAVMPGSPPKRWRARADCPASAGQITGPSGRRATPPCW